jgi:hypothetical protein
MRVGVARVEANRLTERCLSLRQPLCV